MPRTKRNQTSPDEIQIADITLVGDLVPAEPLPWKQVMPKIHNISQTFGYQRIETSPVETMDYFTRAKKLFDSLEESVALEMEGGKPITLRTHNFLSILRAYFENEVYKTEKITKWYYLSPVFSRSGNKVLQNFEYGLAVLGDHSTVSEAHMISMLKSLLEGFGIEGVLFEINSQGCSDCSKAYEDVLIDSVNSNRNFYCGNCQDTLTRSATAKKPEDKQQIYEVFKCGQKSCQQALDNGPQIIDFLDDKCNKHLTSLLESLDELDIDYQLSPKLFGGKHDTQTLFRVKVSSGNAEEGGAPTTLGTVTRCTSLVNELTGQDVPMLFLSIPFNDFYRFVTNHGHGKKRHRTADVFLISLGDLAAKKSLKLFMDLLNNNIRVAEQFGENGIKNQFKLAEQKGCSLALIIGQKEAVEGSVILREVRSGVQEVFSGDRIIEEVLKRLQN